MRAALAGDEDTLPASLREVLVRRTRACAPGTAEVLRVVSAAGSEVPGAARGARRWPRFVGMRLDDASTRGARQLLEWRPTAASRCGTRCWPRRVTPTCCPVSDGPARAAGRRPGGRRRTFGPVWWPSTPTGPATRGGRCSGRCARPRRPRTSTPTTRRTGSTSGYAGCGPRCRTPRRLVGRRRRRRVLAGRIDRRHLRPRRRRGRDHRAGPVLAAGRPGRRPGAAGTAGGAVRAVPARRRPHRRGPGGRPAGGRPGPPTRRRPARGVVVSGLVHVLDWAGGSSDWEPLADEAVEIARAIGDGAALARAL